MQLEKSEAPHNMPSSAPHSGSGALTHATRSAVSHRAMRHAIVLALLLALYTVKAGADCEISGDARLWAYDACLWRYETDDTLHPGVIDCIEKNQSLIAEVVPARPGVSSRAGSVPLPDSGNLNSQILLPA